MKEPLVSVVMPSYNSEKHIAESIQSIIDQTFTGWEFIIVDGHSKDKTIEIIESFMAKESRIKLLYDEGKGIGPALNMGCAAARGKYIARMDTDDISYPNRLSTEIEYLESHSDIVLVSCLTERINEEGAFLSYGLPYTANAIVRKHFTLISHPGVMMRKDAYLRAGGYPPLKRAEDLFLWHRLSNYGEIRIIKDVLVKYRMSDTALSATSSSFFYEHVESLWSIVSKKELIEKQDYDYLNFFIEQNILKHPKRENFERPIQDNMFGIIQYIMPQRAAIQIVLFIKNLYGYIHFMGLR